MNTARLTTVLAACCALGFGLPHGGESFAGSQTTLTPGGQTIGIPNSAPRGTDSRSTASDGGLGGTDTIKGDELGKAAPPKPSRFRDEAVKRALAGSGEMPGGGVHPPRVRELAVRSAAERYPPGVQRTDFVKAFQEGFRFVLAAPDQAAAPGKADSDNPTAAGFALGRAAAVSNAAALGISLLDYGYVYTNAVGRVVLGFERSELQPRAGGQVWWLAGNAELRQGVADLSRQPADGARQTRPVVGSIMGYLSPARAGGYGHLGSYAQEFVAEKVLELKLEDAPP